MASAHPRSVGPRRPTPATSALPPPAPPATVAGQASIALAPHLSSIGHGRRWVAAEAARCGVGTTGLRIVQLLASELIANAVVHGPPGGAITVRALRSDDRLRVEVDDNDSTARPRLLHRDHVDAGGRGLMLVDRFADRWGYDLRGADGKTVWFECVQPARLRAPRRGSPAPPTGPGPLG